MGGCGGGLAARDYSCYFLRGEERLELSQEHQE